MQSFLKSIAKKIRSGEMSLALNESKKHAGGGDRDGQKVQCYLLLKNQKYPEADSLCTKLLGNALDHELFCWRGIARAELGLWHSALQDLNNAYELFPKLATQQRIEFTTRRACKNISEGMQLDGGSYNDYIERARIYVLNRDFVRAERDLRSASEIKPEKVELRKLEAIIAFAKDDLKPALTEIDAYLEDEPEDLDAVLLKVKIKANTGRLRTALALLRQATKSKRRDELSQLKIANCRADIRDYHGAIKDFDATLDLNPDSSGAYFGRGLAFVEIRKFDDAIRDFEWAIEKGGKNCDYYTALGEAKLAKASKKEASTHFKTAMKIEPKSWKARLGYAKVKNMRGKRTEASKIASDILKKHPSHHEVHLFLGTVQFEETDYVSAIESFSDAIRHCHTSFETAGCYYRRGTAKLENGQISEAIEDFDSALKLRPFHVGTLVWRGYAFGKLGKWAQAIGDLQSAIDMNPMAAEQYKKLGDFIAEHAIQHFGTLIRQNKSDPEAYFNRGMANLFLGRNDKAYLDFEKTLLLNPKHGEAQVRLGTLYLKDNQSKQAYNFFSDAMKTKPSATALLMRAEAMLQLGVIQPALLDIRDAIRTSRDNDRLYVRRGELYAAKDNLEKALDDFTLSIALNFDNFQAFRNRGKLFERRGLLPEAIRDYSMSLHFFPKQPDLLVARGKLRLRLEQFDLAAEDFETALGSDHYLDAYTGRAEAILNLDRGQDALIWLTKAIHRFSEPEEWAQLVKARAGIFLALGRYERASADARIASKLNRDPIFAADCYYIRALCSYRHNDKEHTLKSLEKAYSLDENHEQAELALDWFKEMADAPPAEWQNAPVKIRPTRPKAEGSPAEVQVDEAAFAIDPPMDLWLVKKGTEEFGPIPLKTVVDWAADGRIDSQTLLFRTDWGKWKSAGKIIPQMSSTGKAKDISRVASPPVSSSESSST